MHTRKKLEKRSVRRAGFTLLEVLLVLAILGVIAAMVIPNLLGRQEGAMRDQTKVSIAGLENTLKQYAIQHNGKYPEGDAQAMLEALLLNPVDKDGNPVGPYLETRPKDAWENPLFYEYPASSKMPTNINKPAIWSAGPNGDNEDGGGDDINNWSELLEQ